MIRYFDSPAHMARTAAESHSKRQANSQWNMTDESWSGPGQSGIESMLRIGGDESDVPAAMKLLDKLSLELPETERAEFVPSVCGAFPCVPDAIIGMPEPMRQRQTVPNDGAPIRIGVVTTVSADISLEAFRAKAAALLAILIHLNNAGRAVELYGISTMAGGDKSGETVLAYRIATSPMSLAECNMALGNLAFARRIPFTIACQCNDFDGRWPYDAGWDNGDNGAGYCANLAKRMGFNMILPCLHSSEAQEITSNPAKWMLAKYNAIQAQLDGEA